ncbi:hypothetical protein BUALT_BualtUnG0054400 [Buddleja alternifolia]|uniref:AAA+ ATPase domain-containing protein n=1 Tax=Buddleja alternifolia TaxID=168488 RepID=A0AAV6W069_9LAMI|nr:hypothetical protein BUALT_BualtUnG0054400 [Buddleja alternifolia]
MAEAAVATVICKAVEIAGYLLSGRMNDQPNNLQENISWIESHMRILQSYLEDAESKKNGSSHEVANLIISIRDLAYDVEDILDAYLSEIQSHNTRGRFQFLKHASCMLCYGVKTNNFVVEIEKIKKRAAALEVCGRNCGITVDSSAAVPSSNADLWGSRKLFLRAPESKIFSREETLQKLEEALVRENNRCRIVSIVGPGGVGKTTVAKRIYHKVKDEFQSAAIVYISQEPKVGEILLDIAKQVGLNKDERNEDLEKNLYSFLEDKRYVIFLDDVWDTKIWDRLRNVIPTNSENGSRIIVTSRSADVGRYIGGGESSLIPLNILSENEGRELFFDLIFSASEEPLPPILKDIGEEIVVRCGGLPLALVVAVGMLQSKERSKHAWNEILASMKEGDENDCLNILALSYHDLPFQLKPFFLYFGVFPEGREIFVSELTRLWLAEKLIQVDGFRKLDSIVEAHIDKLISKNLIQVSRRRSDGRVRSCRIHDLLHKLCIQMAEDSNFFSTHNNLLQSVGFNSIVRRVTTNSWSSSEDAFQNFRLPPKLRSLLCFREGKELLNFMKRNASDLRFLNLLTIEVEGIKSHLPSEIANLSGLKYFKLKGEFIVLPPSISRLKKLETLEVRSGVIVPRSILEMNQLKHLILIDVSIDEPTHNSSHLVSMFDHHRVDVALENLETLHFRFDNWFYIKPSSIRKMSNLRKLCVSNYPDHEMMKYQYLVKLHLCMHTKIKGSFEFPPNLVKITFESIYILGDFIEPLKKLFKLEIIKLKNCRAEQLDFSGEHNYPQLQVLVLWDTDFSELVVDEKGMPKLDTILYQPYPFPPLPTIPERLEKMMVTTDQYS